MTAVAAATGRTTTCSGVYTITTDDGKVYVGAGADIFQRWRSHRSQLGKGIHPNPGLQAAFDHFGDEGIEYAIFAEADEAHRWRIEAALIKQLCTTNPECGYNCTHGGKRGARLTERYRRKIAQGMKRFRARQRAEREAQAVVAQYGHPEMPF